MAAINVERIRAVIQSRGGVINEEIVTAARSANYKQPPEGLPAGLQGLFSSAFPAGLYRHQALGIEIGLKGANVCLATPTASGKTLVFASIVLSRLMRSAGATALVLYPAKALVADQASKWDQLASACDLSVEVIDGSVPVKDREAKLVAADVVLMTPDVLHAWLLARSDEPHNAEFLKHLRITVLDEAHIYEGVFGTNMAYLMRRLRATSGVSQFIASTATVAAPEKFLSTLLGLPFTVVGEESDGSPAHEKTFSHVTVPQRQLAPTVKELVHELCASASETGKFIAFVDSRKQVEELVASVLYKHGAEGEGEGTAELEDGCVNENSPVLPYRSGYEEVDRTLIQRALTRGKLVGVIATSALELGVDIGEITTALIVGVPTSVKSFWQRAGRAGRSSPGAVVILDSWSIIPPGKLNAFLAKPAEENWLYLDNEYLQFANVLCAAEEAIANVGSSLDPFKDLPPSFLSLLENERKPTRPLPNDLYAMKQQASSLRPHLAFPVRTGIEKQYKVVAPRLPGVQLGTLGYAQLLNEGYPGAIYRYMSRAYRVYEINHGQSQVRTNRVSGLGRTVAKRQAMAFPLYPHGVMTGVKSKTAFVFESKMQVSERVTGFTEIWGAKRVDNEYGVGSPYSQKSLNRHFDSSGVALYFSGLEYPKETCARYLSRAFCRTCGVHEREIGYGLFSANLHPLGDDQVLGMAVYDSVQGSLRLTRQFMQRLADIFDEAIELAAVDDAKGATHALGVLRDLALECEHITANEPVSSIEVAFSEWMEVISDGAKGILHDGVSHVNEEVTVERFLYTPQGPVYFLKPTAPGSSWRVSASLVKPLPGLSTTYKYNVNTGETG